MQRLRPRHDEASVVNDVQGGYQIVEATDNRIRRVVKSFDREPLDCGQFGRVAREHTLKLDGACEVRRALANAPSLQCLVEELDELWVVDCPVN